MAQTDYWRKWVSGSGTSHLDNDAHAVELDVQDQHQCEYGNFSSALYRRRFALGCAARSQPVRLLRFSVRKDQIVAHRSSI